jgi:predicted nuclease of predicted toxin-antitoxin system
LSLKLLIDECLLDKLLVSKLRNAGHDVVTVLKANLIRTRDAEIFAYAIEQKRLVITLNCSDFVDLASGLDNYPGILLVYLNNNPGTDMSYDSIVKAIGNLEESRTEISNAWHILNQYNW